jgi:hypothetical protein
MWSSLNDLAQEKVLHLTTLGRKTGLPREIEIWFIVCCGCIYLFAETGETADWVKNIRHEPPGSRCGLESGKAGL